MNVDWCANCLMHGWDQVSDESKLQRCESCHVVLYCGKECQKEHWFKLHKYQCNFLKDPATAEGMQHKRKDCAICKQADKVGEFKLKKSDNPNYGCVYEGFQWPPHLHHPHPFPITGQPEDTYEKGIIVLLNLLRKVELTQPRVKRNCKKELDMVFAQLIRIRCFIWRNKKIFPQSHTQKFLNNLDYGYLPDFGLLLPKVKTCKREYMRSPFDLWKVILLVKRIILDAYFTKHMLSLKDPLMDFPAEFQLLLYNGLNNSDKFLARANQILDALTNQLISYQDILLIICAGSCEKTCSLCSKAITISPEGGAIFFNSLFMDEYFCERESCRDKVDSMVEDYDKFQTSVYSLYDERKKIRCDNCYQLPSGKKVHRCTACWSTMYCGKACQVEDWKIHKKVCKEDLEERKKKSGGKDRRAEAKDALEKLEERFTNRSIVSQEKACCRSEIINKFKIKVDKKDEK